jgi:acetyl-CoA carboxylase biotin carboxylase subunit
MDRMSRCLAETRVEGVQTTLPFYRRLFKNEYYRRGEVATNFVRRRMLTDDKG